jgi:hypothetical protein
MSSLLQIGGSGKNNLGAMDTVRNENVVVAKYSGTTVLGARATIGYRRVS